MHEYSNATYPKSDRGVQGEVAEKNLSDIQEDTSEQAEMIYI